MTTVDFNTLSDIDVERAMLYLLFESENTEQLILDLALRDHYFINPISSDVFKKMKELINVGKKIDYFILKDLYTEEKELQQFENFFAGVKFIPEIEHVEDYLIILKKNYKRSEIKKETKILEKAILDKDFQKIKLQQAKIAEFDMSVEEFQNDKIGMAENTDLAIGMDERIDGKVDVSNTILKTGYPTIDNSIGGFERGNYIVLAARPSIGKSVVLINLMEQMKSQGYKVAMFSGELYADIVFRRIVSRNLNISSQKLKFPNKLSSKEKAKIKKFTEELKKDKSRHIYYNLGMTAQMIYEEALKIKNKYGLDAIFMDYMGKMKANDTNITKGYEKVTAVSNELYELAGKLDVVVVTASQLNRASVKENEDLVPPQLHNLRESGAIEQDIDIGMGLYRNVEESKLCRTEDDKTDFYINIMKNRNGPLDDFAFDFYPVTGRLVDKFDVTNDIEQKNITDKDKLGLIEDMIEKESNIDDITGGLFDN